MIEQVIIILMAAPPPPPVSSVSHAIPSGSAERQVGKTTTNTNHFSSKLVVGKASRYYGSRGFHGKPHIAMQNGHWTGRVNRYVLLAVNGSRFRKLPVVDYCQCYRGTDQEKIVDLSSEAVRLFGLNPDDGVYDVAVKELK